MRRSTLLRRPPGISMAWWPGCKGDGQSYCGLLQRPGQPERGGHRGVGVLGPGAPHLGGGADLGCAHGLPGGPVSTAAGQLARTLAWEMGSLGTFVVEAGGEPTNNRVARALRCAVRWRKMMHGTYHAKGERGVERMLSPWETGRRRGRSTARSWRTRALAP